MPYRLAADVGMPDFGVEFHDWRLEWVVIWYSDVDGICASFIRGTGGAQEGSLEMGQVVAVTDQGCGDLGEVIALDIGDFFGDAAVAVAHGEQAVWAVGSPVMCRKAVRM